MNNEKRIIYALKCPFTNDIHYIGKSTNGIVRPLQHMKKSHSYKINDWVQELSFIGHKPKIEILEKVSENDDIDKKELIWIQRCLDKGDILLNSNLVSPTLINTKLEKLLEDIDIRDINHIAEFIKQRRKILGLTQEEFSLRCGIGLKTLRKIEQNNSNFMIKGLLDVLAMFGCTIDIKKVN